MVLKIPNIKGIQKTTLIDYPELVASTVFFGGCNLRCRFCHNVSLVYGADKDIDANEVIKLLLSRKNLIDAVCISGGEPTVTSELPIFIRELKKHGFSVKLDTNGFNPVMVRDLIKEKLLDYIAIDIKTSKEKYEQLVGKCNLNLLMDTIRIIKASKVPHEWRMTALPMFSNQEDLENIGEWVGGKKENFYLQAFQPHTTLLDQSFETMGETSEIELNRMKQILNPYFAFVGVRK